MIVKLDLSKQHVIWLRDWVGKCNDIVGPSVFVYRKLDDQIKLFTELEELTAKRNDIDKRIIELESKL